ncbi:MAG: nucleotidyltransferase [Candidatus Solibacter usitatus]|nr:nucleotidyltransferase [Candidatus Solibacter usitatus]
MNSDFRELLSIFNTAGVRYLIVGGHAVMLYTQPRYTKDYDLWVDPSPENARAVFQALAEFGAPLGETSPEEFAVPDLVFMMGVAPAKIDVMTSISGVQFAEAWERRQRVACNDIEAWFIHREDLIRNKRAAGRPQDLVDADLLEGKG